MQHLPGGDAIDRKCLDLDGVELSSDEHQIQHVDFDGARPRSNFCDRGEAVANQSAIHALTDGAHGADQVVPGNEGERGLVVILTAAHLLLGERHPGHLHLKNHVPGLGRLKRDSAHDQTFRGHASGQNDLDSFLNVVRRACHSRSFHGTCGRAQGNHTRIMLRL